MLRELEGLSYGEIAKRMGITPTMVHSTLFRARRRLSQEYVELSSGRRCQHVRQVIDARQERALSALGLRERRRIAVHLDHCPECLRYSRAARIDDAVLRPSRLGRTVAALLPVGWPTALWRRGRTTFYGSRVAGAKTPTVGHGLTTLAAQRLGSGAAALTLAGGLPAMGVIVQGSSGAAVKGGQPESTAAVSHVPVLIAHPLHGSPVAAVTVESLSERPRGYARAVVGTDPGGRPRSGGRGSGLPQGRAGAGKAGDSGQALGGDDGGAGGTGSAGGSSGAPAGGSAGGGSSGHGSDGSGSWDDGALRLTGPAASILNGVVRGATDAAQATAGTAVEGTAKVAVGSVSGTRQAVASAGQAAGSVVSTVSGLSAASPAPASPVDLGAAAGALGYLAGGARR